jgi:hypothetical protein
MYCKKCGTEQKNGQKFCPKCGEPFVVSNDTPNQGLKSEKPIKVSDSLSDKAEELSQKGKSFIEEKILPLIKGQIEDFKKIDWEEKKKESKEAVRTFLSDKDKMRSATIWIAIISVLWFFIFKSGFSASWYWWLFAIAFIVGAFYKIKAKDEAYALKKTRLTLICAVFLGLVFIFHSSGGGALGGECDSDISYKANNDREEQILLEMARIRGEINSILPRVEALYNAHQNYMATRRGYLPSSSPAWGKWQDCKNEIDNLWEKYIREAQSLDDNEDIIEEARESKRKMDRAFRDMFEPRY